MLKVDAEYKKKIVELAKNLGADVVGVASAESLSGAREGHKPRDIMPWAANAIVIGAQMLPGSINRMNLSYHTQKYLDNQKLSTEPREAGAAGFVEIYNYQSTYLVNLISGIDYKIAKFIESSGYKAIDIVPEYHKDHRTQQAIISIKHAAVAAGIGTFGLSGLVLHHEFGSRLRFGIVLSNAPLEPDLPLKTDVCTKCGACVKICPSRAIEMPDNPKALNAYKVDWLKCYMYSTYTGMDVGNLFWSNGCGYCNMNCPCKE